MKCVASSVNVAITKNLKTFFILFLSLKWKIEKKYFLWKFIRWVMQKHPKFRVLNNKLVSFLCCIFWPKMISDTQNCFSKWRCRWELFPMSSSYSCDASRYSVRSKPFFQVNESRETCIQYWWEIRSWSFELI